MSEGVAAQKRFNEKYITSREIGIRLGVTRTALLNARLKGTLPNAIYVDGANMYIWEREDVEPHIQKWHMSIARRRLG